MGSYETIKGLIDQNITTNAQGLITGSVLNATLKSIVDTLGVGCRFCGAINTSSSITEPDGNVFYFATQGGTYANCGNVTIQDGLAIIKWENGSWGALQLLWYDSVPTPNSSHLVLSSGVYEAIQDAIETIEVGATEIYDISAANAVSGTPASYASLSAALALVPQVLQKGGISIKYVDSTSGKYVQYRLVSTTWSIDADNWELTDKMLIRNSNEDLNFCDESYNIVLSIRDGHIRTKHFDSKDALSSSSSAESQDLQFVDENGNTLVMFGNGHIRTSKFNSANIKDENLSQTLQTKLSNLRKNNLEGKRVAFLGDSITQGSSATSQKNTYHGVFCDLYGAIDRTAELYEETGEYILGINATCIAANTKNGQGSKRFVTRATAENFADSKLIVVFGGTNDLSYDIKPIGDLFVEETITATGNMGTKKLTAPTDTETFAGALHELIQTIQEECPLVPIVLLTPLKRNHNSASNPDYITCNSNGDFMIDFVNAIKEIGAFYGIPVLDLYSNSNLNPLAPSGSSIFSDGLHPNNKGHKIIGELLYRFVEENVIIN